jgi:hypothetical protein
MQMTWRRLRLLVMAAVALLLVGHGLLVHLLAGRLQAGFNDWAAHRRAQGWQVAHGAIRVDGWPFTARIAVPELQLEAPSAVLAGGFALRADRAEIAIRLPRIDRLAIDLPGMNRLRLPDWDLPFVADLIRVTIPLAPGEPTRAGRLEAEQLRVGTPTGASVIGRLEIEVAGSSTATEAEAALSFQLLAETVDLPPGLPPPAPAFGRRLQTLRLEGEVSGPVPAGRGTTARAEAWREGGGTLRLLAARLVWGPITAETTATLSLDEALQPMGAGRLRLSGAGPAIDALTESGLIGRRAAATARAMLPLLPRAEAEPDTIDLPLAIEDRTLRLARIPLARFAPLGWPAP